MKNIQFILTALLTGLFAVACEEQPIDDLSGVYDDIARYEFTEVEQLPTEKLGKGIKALVLKLKNAEGDVLELRIGSAEWVLRANTYAATAEVAADKEFSAVLNGSKTVAAGDLNINLMNDIYIFSGLLATTDGLQIQCNYRGALSFEIGEDDPEASGYTIRFSSQPVYQLDAMGQPIGTVEGVMQYTFLVSDPAGQPAAQFVAINGENMEASELGGTYTIQGSPTEAGLMDNGWALPAEWGGAFGGSYAVDEGGVKQFITAGQIVIEVVDGIDGSKLYTFSGSALTTTLGMNSDGSSTPGTLTEVNIRYASIQNDEPAPEVAPSGYRADVTTEAVIIQDWTANPPTETEYPDLSKYTFKVYDPDGNQVAEFVAINTKELQIPELAGAYTIQGNPCEAGLMDNGWVMPDYNLAGGTYFTDETGTRRYITEGSVSVATADYEGVTLYTFSGRNVSTIGADGADAGAATFNIWYVELN